MRAALGMCAFVWGEGGGGGSCELGGETRELFSFKAFAKEGLGFRV